MDHYSIKNRRITKVFGRISCLASRTNGGRAFQQQIVSRQKRTEGQRRIIKEANPSWTLAISSREDPGALKFLLDGRVNSLASDSNTKVASRRDAVDRAIQGDARAACQRILHFRK